MGAETEGAEALRGTKRHVHRETMERSEINSSELLTQDANMTHPFGPPEFWFVIPLESRGSFVRKFIGEGEYQLMKKDPDRHRRDRTPERTRHVLRGDEIGDEA